MPQTTIKNAISCAGIGLHSGETVHLNAHPASINSGLVFIRSDIDGKANEIPAQALAVSTTQLGTNLTNADGVTIATVEHFLAACAGLGIDNLRIEIDGPELPIMDGSAAEFTDLILSVGLENQSAPKRRLKINKQVEVIDGDKRVSLSPGSGFQARIAIDFPTKAIGRQVFTYIQTPTSFAEEIAPARTFGFASDVEKLHALGMARGGSLDNAIVIDGDQILNPEGLRTEDEFVRHKLLDVIGDLALAGGPIEGFYEGERPGHAMNNRLLRSVFADPNSFEWVEDSAE